MLLQYIFTQIFLKIINLKTSYKINYFREYIHVCFLYFKIYFKHYDMSQFLYISNYITFLNRFNIAINAIIKFP